MKSILKLSNVLVILLVLFSKQAHASFPNKLALDTKTTLNQTTISYNTSEASIGSTDIKIATNAKALAGKKNMVISLLLWFFLGWIAGHRWYHGKPWGWNLLFIFTAGGLGIWWIVDLIFILTDKF